MTRPLISGLLAILTTTPVAALAQSDSVSLDDIIVSGGFTDIAANAYGRSVTVVTGDEIAARGVQTIQDALRALPGLSVSSAGSDYTQIRIRGAESNHTLILIDGVAASGGTDEYILSGLDAANIEKIEVLRGPQSVFYGSNASAGVINIITKKGDTGLHYGGTAEIGDGASASLHISQRGEKGGLSFTASSRDDLGFDQSGDGGEKDGSRRTTVGLTGDWQATDHLKLGFTLHHADENYDYDSANYSATDAASYIVDDPTQYSSRIETQGSVWGQYDSLDGRMRNRLEYQDTRFTQSFDGGAPTTGTTAKLKYQFSYGLDGKVDDARQIINVLAEAQADRSNASADYRRDLRSAAVEYRGQFANGLDLQAGLRYDDNHVFPDFLGWTLGLSWQVPSSGLRLHASAGRAEVDPTFYELFADDAYSVGNPNLKPERNTGFDLGVEAQLPDGRGVVDVTFFKERMTDEITYAFGAGEGGRGSYTNAAGNSPRQGVEFSGKYQATDKLELSFSGTLLDARNPDGSIEIRRPKAEVTLSGTLQTFGGRGTVTVDLRHVAGNYDTQFWGDYATVELPAFTTVDVSTKYKLTDNVSLTARVSNLTDSPAVEVWGYATRGRTAYVGVQADW